MMKSFGIKMFSAQGTRKKEDTLIDLLVAIAKVMGISGEGMAGIVGVTLFVLLFLVIAVGGKIFFGVLAYFGHDFTSDRHSQQFEFEDNLSLYPSKSIHASNINTRSMFDN